MKRHEKKDVAQRLLEDYLEHVERWWVESSPHHDRVNVVVLDVMQYRRVVARTAKSEARRATLP